MSLAESAKQTLENLSPSQRKSIQQIASQARIELARRNCNDFCEAVLKDEKGEHVFQAEIQREIQWHIDECRKRGIYCGILAPWRHSKTEGVVIARTLKFLGESQENRIFIVCNSDENAKARVASVAKYIEYDEDYKRVYPEVKTGDKQEWTKHKLIIDRKSKIKDGSVEAWGITSSGTGSGCDIMIVDDPVDLRNAILLPALRLQVKEAFYNVWLTRLTPEGFLIYIATTWHEDDLTTELQKNPRFCFLKIAVAEDFSCMECESPLKGKFKIPLWNAKWDKKALVNRYQEIGSRAFNRGFRQIALSDEDMTFPSYKTIFKYGVNASDIIRPEWPRFGGMDPFGQNVVIFILARSPEGIKYVVDIRCGKWSPTKSVEELIDACQTHQPQIMVVENNAAQEAIRQWALEKGARDLPLMPFTTGQQKANPVMGLPGLEVEFENKAWIVAMGDKPHDPDCRCNLCGFKHELSQHPTGKAADIVMAAWFAREGVRFIESQAAKEPEQAEEVITAEDMGIPRVEIGDY